MHGQGQGETLRNSIEGYVRLDDPNVSLEALGSGLEWPVQNGTFELHVVDQSTGQRSTHLVTVDPQNDSLADIVNQINNELAIPDVTASVGPNGEFRIEGATGRDVTFTADTSGFLAALGVNGFFSGNDATNIAVDQTLLDDPSLLATASDFTPGSNGTALAMVDLESKSIDGLGGRSLPEDSLWRR